MERCVPANTNQRFANAVPVSPFHAYTVKSHAVLVQVPVYFSQMLRPSTAFVWVCVSRYVCPPARPFTSFRLRP